jgi:hypothetical protein
MAVLAHADDESLASAAIQILGGFSNRRPNGSHALSTFNRRIGVTQEPGIGERVSLFLR